MKADGTASAELVSVLDISETLDAAGPQYRAADIAAERQAVVRFCARYTGDPGVAEDLAQKTMLHAWGKEQQLRDPQSRRAWLFAIARRECITWGRGRKRAQMVDFDSLDESQHAGLLASDFDVEVELGRAELANLLDRAMHLLAPELREVLVRRYIEESPQAEVARSLGLTEGAVEARLHRGKLALRRVLSTDLSDQAVALGLIPGSEAGWEQTPVWCPACGRRKLEGWFRREEGRLLMRCPDCPGISSHIINASGEGLKGVQTYRPAVSRVLDTIHSAYRVRARHQANREALATPCPRCGRWLPVRRGRPDWVGHSPEESDSAYFSHPECGLFDMETWHALTWSLPEARRFWKDNPRMRFMPATEVDFGGSPAVVTGFESITGSARLEVVTLRHTLEVVSIRGHRSEAATDSNNG